MSEYNAYARRAFIEGLDREALSLRDISALVKKEFGLDKQPSPATIKRDLEAIAKAQEAMDPVLATYSEWLSDPEHFPTWRATFFTTPEGQPYETPAHQMALFHVCFALTHKTPIPEWVLEYLDLGADINDHLEKRESLLTFILLAPPRHGKTELMIHLMLYMICFNPNVRIIYCSGIKSTSQDNMGLVMYELEHNEALIEAYGPFKSEDRQWSRKDGFYVAKATGIKTPNIYPIGIRSNVLSKDADIIIVDDPEDYDDANSSTTSARNYSWFTTNLMTRRSKHTPVFGVGSHQPSEEGDLWSQLEENLDQLRTERGKIYMAKLQAHDYSQCDPNNDPEHVECVLWHTVCPYWFLEAQRAALGDIMFEVCYNQEGRLGRIIYFDGERMKQPYFEPQPEMKGAPIPIVPEYHGGVYDEFRSWRQVPKGHCGNGGIGTVLGVDPAASTAKGASYTALVVKAACLRCGRRFVVDYETLRQSPEKHPDLILSFIDSYPEISRVRIEVNAYQKALANDPRLTGEQSRRGFIIEEWYTDDRKADPKMGVPTLWHAMKEGRLSVPYRDETDKRLAQEYVGWFTRWPKKPDDLPMADWLTELSIRDMIDEYLSMQHSINLPGWENAPDYLSEQNITIPAEALQAHDARRRGW